MGLRILREIMSVIKEKGVVREAWDKTLVVAKFLCGLHVANTYLCTVVLVSLLLSPCTNALSMSQK